MMEKRNFVTSARTPMDGASEIDDVLAEGARCFGSRKATKDADAFEKKASAEDEKSDSGI